MKAVSDAVEERRLALVDALSAACAEEIAGRRPDDAVPWSEIPTVAAMAVHLGGVHRWVARVVRTGRAARSAPPPDLPPESLGPWFAEGRAALLDALTATPPETPCWVLGGRIGTAGVWRRRMVFEHAKHLIDLRAAGGFGWTAAPELRPADYADGIDELVAEFLPRSRQGLHPLPGPVVLTAIDVHRTWRFSTDWTVDGRVGGDVEVVGTAGDLALLLWERADPGSVRLRVHGDRVAAAALAAAPIHPW